MRQTRWMLALVALAGCAVSHEARPESGSRIRAVWLAPSSGERIFWRWHDSELDVDCGFHPMMDGTLRCVPADIWWYGRFDYADADCTVPVVANARCDSRYLLEQVTDVSACPPTPFDEYRWRLWQLGEPESVSRVYRLDDSGACTASDTVPESVRPLALMDESALVAARVVPSTSSEAIVQDRYVADDGTSWPGAARDRARGSECFLSGLPLGDLDRLPCTPEAHVFVSEPNAECDTRYAHWPSSTCAPSGVEVVPRLQNNNCGTLTSAEVYPVVSEVPPGTANPSCYQAGDDALELGPRADDLVPWFDVHRTEGRLQQSILEAPGVRVPWLSYLHDDELGIACIPTLFDDGVLRCAPLFGWRGGVFLYADSDCTEPAIAIQDCPESPYVYAQGGTDACGGPTLGTFYRASDPIDTAYARDHGTGECTEIPPEERLVYRAEVVSPDELAALERVVE